MTGITQTANLKPTLATSAGRATSLLLVAALVASTAPVLPRGWEAATLLSGERDEQAVASYQLGMLAPDDYAAAIKTALAAGDADLADSLRALALKQSVQLPEALTSEVDDALAAAHSRMAADAWARICLRQCRKRARAGRRAGRRPQRLWRCPRPLSGIGEICGRRRASTRPPWRWPRSASR